jgi:3-deoxy-7-phosphoheptulonate synthase
VLRGGGGRANYDTVSISVTERRSSANPCLTSSSTAPPIPLRSTAALVMSDCVPDPGRQSLDRGLIVEISSGQPIPSLSKLRYGCSVTDPCIVGDTETMIRKEADTLKAVLPQRGKQSPDSHLEK